MADIRRFVATVLGGLFLLTGCNAAPATTGSCVVNLASECVEGVTFDTCQRELGEWGDASLGHGSCLTQGEIGTCDHDGRTVHMYAFGSYFSPRPADSSGREARNASEACEFMGGQWLGEQVVVPLNLTLP